MRALLLVLLLAALPGCRDWNEKELRFADYAAYDASDLAPRGFLPQDLVPRSARSLVYVQNWDTNEVKLDFDFDPGEEAMIVAPFLSHEMRLQDALVADGSMPPPPPSDRRMEVRCGERAVEFLRITAHKHASYWTSTDPAIRARSCATAPATRTAA